MDQNTDEIRRRIDALKFELAATRARIATLRRRRDGRKSNLAVVIAGTFACVLAFAFFASAQVPHVPGKRLPGRRMQLPPVHAPFVIRDEHGVPVLLVRDALSKPPKVDTAPEPNAGEPQAIDLLSYRGAYVCNSAGAAVATMQAIDGGGAVRAMEAIDPEKRVTIAATNQGEGLGVRNGTLLVDALGEATGGSINVYGSAGFPVAAITSAGGKGIVGVYDTGTGKPLVYLTENKLGAGELGGVDASLEDLGYYVQGGPNGAVCCVFRKEKGYFMGEKVLLK